MAANPEQPRFSEHPACVVARESIARNERSLRERLVSWANINSGSDHPQGLERMANAIIAAADFLPIPVERLQDPRSGEICALRWRQSLPGKRSLLLNGHLDTVYDREHPFQTCRQLDDGRIQGPGVTDMKGGLVILFAALEAFLHSELSRELSWEILITFDEETGSLKSRPILEQAAQEHDFGIVFESSLPDGALIRNRMGTGKVDVAVNGRSAHAGRDFQEGRNAIAALASFVFKAHALNAEIPDGIINPGFIQGGGPVNVVPERAQASFNVRAKTPSAERQIMGALEELARDESQRFDCPITLSGGFNRPAKCVDSATEALFEAWQQTAQAIGYELHWRDTGGASDGNLLQSAGLPNIDNLGACGANIHSDSEYIDCRSLVERSQLVVSFLINFAGGRFGANAQRFSRKTAPSGG